MDYIRVVTRDLDKVIIICVLFLCLASIIISISSGSVIASRFNMNTGYYVKRHIIYTILSMMALLIIPYIDIKSLKRLILLSFVIGIILMILILLVGVNIKGSKRWIYIANISIQPSEFIKPLFAVVVAMILHKSHTTIQAYIITCSLYIFIVLLLILQPDFGMILTVTYIYLIQIFIYGLPIGILVFLILLCCVFIIFAYFSFAHIKKRIDSFLNPDSINNFQVNKAEATMNSGGWFGIGAGSGDMKYNLPDAHTDFIFSLIGEEYGALGCIAIIFVFCILIFKIIYESYKNKNDIFVSLSLLGIGSQITFQCLVNMGVNLRLLPTKGMTLPFISYGGSSMLSMGISMGIILCIIRYKRYYNHCKIYYFT